LIARNFTTPGMQFRIVEKIVAPFSQ